MGNSLDPVLYRTPIIDKVSGLMTREWIRFFEQVQGFVSGTDLPLQAGPNVTLTPTPDVLVVSVPNVAHTNTPNTFTGLQQVTGDFHATGIVQSDSILAGNTLQLAIPAPISSGGTGSFNAPGARANLTVPGLGDNNVFTGINTFSPALIHFGLDFLAFAPTITPSGSMTAVPTTAGIFGMEYCRFGPMVYIYARLDITLGGTLSFQLTFNLPVAPMASFIEPMQAKFNYSAGSILGEDILSFVTISDTNLMINHVTNFPGAGDYTFYLSGIYRCA